LAADWLADLEEFGPEAVESACREWRRGQSKRPTIADMRALCKETASPREMQQLPPPPDYAAIERARQRAATKRQRTEEAYAWRQRFAEERGFADFSEVIDYGIVRASKLPLV